MPMVPATLDCAQRILTPTSTYQRKFYTMYVVKDTNRLSVSL